MEENEPIQAPLFTIRATQDFSEAEILASKLEEAGVKAEVGVAEIQSAYSNAVQWFQINVPIAQKELATSVLNSLEKHEDNEFISASKAIKTKKDAWFQIIIGFAILLFFIGILVVSAETNREFPIVKWAGMGFGAYLMLKGIYRLRASRK